ATLLDHSALTLSATPLSQQDPGDPPHYREFAFLFWNLRGSLSLEGTTADAYYTVPDVGTAALTATAWYVQVGGGGGDGEGVSTVAFSDDADDFLAATPIAAVTPAGAWAGGDATAVSTHDAAVRITARPAIDAREHFEHWLVFGARAASGPDGAALAVPRHGASL